MIIPIAGPNGTGQLYIYATGESNEWNYHEIRVEIRDQEFDYINNDIYTEF